MRPCAALSQLTPRETQGINANMSRLKEEIDATERLRFDLALAGAELGPTEVHHEFLPLITPATHTHTHTERERERERDTRDSVCACCYERAHTHANARTHAASTSAVVCRERASRERQTREA